jgi:tetratricopeptide (TPR) repeat protein
MRQLAVAVTGVAAVWTVPAVAGDEVLYGSEPSWVSRVELDTAASPGSPLVLLDKQVRLENGTVVAYGDLAYRINSPEALTALGTLKVSWLPDKGDLTIHRLEIVRDGEVIDLLGQGLRYEVLRRERNLEQRSIDGSLTATLAVPGAKLGDILRFSQTISVRDQALTGEVQQVDALPSAPFQIGSARMIYSWPEDEEIYWKAGPGVTLPEPESRDGYRFLTASLPLPERAEMPADAPARFTMPQLLQAGSFASWAELSRTMAPHYSTESAISEDGAIAVEVARIEQRTRDPLERAALALQLVQDEVSYLLYGMNGGNYLPQAPELTWERRYGDCKAKSLLLLAMLRRMGIEAEAVVVRSAQGDMVAEMLPLPAAFDHVIVRATIDGEDYWLDGTSAGTRIDSIDEVPDVRYGLPLRPEGAELMAVAQRKPRTLDRITRVTYDYRAGIDMPALYEAEVEVRGVMASEIRVRANETDREKVLEYAGGYLDALVGEGFLYDAQVSYDQASGIARVTGSGLIYSPWEFERDRAKLAFALSSTGFQFGPDRARSAWRSIPYNVDGPLGLRDEVTVILPQDGAFELAGKGGLEQEVAGVSVSRTGRLEGNRLVLTDQTIKIPGEISPSTIAGEKAKAARLRSGNPVLRASGDFRRYWQHPPEGDEVRLASLERAYAALIAVAPDEAWRWALRGGIREYYPDLEGALADYSEAIELEPTGGRYADRAALLSSMGRIDDAMEDATVAYELDPTLANATRLSDLYVERGEFDDALAILDDIDLSGDDRIELMKTRASVLGEAGRLEEGWNLLEEALAERPDDAGLLDSQCWYMGNWSYALNRALETCDRAVRQSDYATSPHDSRALVRYRLDDREAALDDLKTALASDPGYGTSLYLRGIIRLEKGDRGGDEDISHALRVWGGVGRLFARFGISPAR